MATYLRFTEKIEQDIKKGFSYFKTPSMKKATKLQGLCAFRFDTEIFCEQAREYRPKTKSEMVAEFQQILEASDYIKSDTAVLIEGEYLCNNQNGEGVIIKAKSVLNKFYI
jgi:hypothetical protein